MNTPDRKPAAEAIVEATRCPNGWVYEIDNAYRDQPGVPPEAIMGAWQVDAAGKIAGRFIPNPNYRPKSPKGMYR